MDLFPLPTPVVEAYCLDQPYYNPTPSILEGVDLQIEAIPEGVNLQIEHQRDLSSSLKRNPICNRR